MGGVILFLFAELFNLAQLTISVLTCFLQLLEPSRIPREEKQLQNSELSKLSLQLSEIAPSA